MEYDIAIKLALDAGRYILASRSFSTRIEKLSNEIDRVKDNDIISARTFIANAALCSSEQEAKLNMDLAYSCYVQAANVYVQNNLMDDVILMMQSEIKERINTALGNNFLSRKILGINKTRTKIKRLESEEIKLDEAFKGVAYMAYAKKEYRISLKYLDKPLYTNLQVLKYYATLRKTISSFFPNFDISPFSDSVYWSFCSIPRELNFLIENISRENEISIQEACPNYTAIQEFKK